MNSLNELTDMLQSGTQPLRGSIIPRGALSTSTIDTDFQPSGKIDSDPDSDPEKEGLRPNQVM